MIHTETANERTEVKGGSKVASGIPAEPEVTYIHVVVALISAPLDSGVCVIRSENSAWASPRAYFIAERTDGPYAGLWEFPGGKVDPGETHYQALCREVQEEIGITVGAAQPMLTINAPSVKNSNIVTCLHVWEVLQFSGQPHGAEGQATRWTQLLWQDQSLFLPPNRHMFTALRLGSCMAVLNVNAIASFDQLLRRLQGFERLNATFDQNLFIRLRANGMRAEVYYSVITMLQKNLANSSLKFCIDILPHRTFFRTHCWNYHWNFAAYFPSWWRDPDLTSDLQLAMSHLAAHAPNILRGASCHSIPELQWACEDSIGPAAHFYCLSPVFPTASHPHVDGLGLSEWSKMNYSQLQPGFALGGMQIDNLPHIRESGGFGVAGIACFESDSLSEQWHRMQAALTSECKQPSKGLRGEIG